MPEQIRATQERLNYYCTWARAESEAVGRAYSVLIEHMRATAGTAMKEAPRPAENINADHIQTTLLDLRSGFGVVGFFGIWVAQPTDQRGAAHREQHGGQK